MWKTKKRYMLVLLAILFLTSLIISLSSRNTMGAKEPSERFKGYNKERGQWTTGNLGKIYVEGDFVSYQLRIDKASKVWGAPEFSISFNFHQRSSKAIYVDGFDTSGDATDAGTGFQWSTGDFLPDGTETPPSGWGTHIPTPEAGETWVSGPKINNYMNAWPLGTGDGTPAGSYPAQERYFTVYGMPWTGDHIILFFRAHLALDIIWSNGLEKDLPKALDGDEFQTWTHAWKGASFATGSSRHFYLQYPGIGQKDIPIPIAMYPSTIINGHKYVNNVLFNGWQINLTGQLSLGPSLPPIPYTPSPVYTGPPSWTTGYFEFTGLIEGNYTVREEHRGYTHENITTSGDGYVTDMNIPGGWISFYLPGGGTRTVDFYNSRYIDLTVSKTATSSWERTFTWTIEKTATPTVSEIFVGDKTDVKYTIIVTATPTTNVTGVSGTITINNTNPATVEVYATILDEVWDGTNLKGSQDLTPSGPILIPSGVRTYGYSITLSGIIVGKTYTNKVTVNVTDPITKTYYTEETFSFTTPTELVDEEVDVEDTLYPGGFLGTVSYLNSPETFEYIKTFGPYPTVGYHVVENTATATGKDTGTVWTASATVTINVLNITVSKTAATYWERVFNWTIEKSVEAAQLKPFINDQIEVRYTITVAKTVDTDTFNVSGTITIVNNNPVKPAEVHVIDKIYDGASVVASVDLGTHTIAPLGTLVLNYEITFEATPSKVYTNKAHVALNNYHWNYTGESIGLIGTKEFIGSKTFAYNEPDKKINDEVTVTDIQNVPAGLSLVSSDYPLGGWTTKANATFIVNKVVKPEVLGTLTLEDEASAKGDTQTWYSGKKTLTFTVYDIDVSKTAETWWERSFDWTIDKSVSPTELTLLEGETGTVTYTITITKTVAGDKFKVYGTITIVNNNREKSAVVNVTDIIHRLDGSVVTSQYLGNHTIAPLGTLKLNYEITFAATPGIEYTNRVHVDLENYRWKLDTTKNYLYKTEFTGDANFTFTESTTLIDEWATVKEVETVPTGFSAVVEWGPRGPPPWNVTDSTTIGFTKNITVVEAEPCQYYYIPNTVTLTECDTRTVRQDSALVTIHVGKPPPPPKNPPSFEFKHKTSVEQVQVGWNKTITIEVANTGVPQSRIYYLTFTAVIGNYDLLQFVGPSYIAHIKIYYNDGTIWEADIFGTLTYEKFAGYDIMGDYWMVTWRVPTTYLGGPYLEGNYGGYLKAKAEISFKVTGVAAGDTWLVFFPRATEDHHSVGVPLSSVTDKANIWESDGFWYPVHNSYDPYDSDIETGHAFVNPSWVTLPTTNKYAWAIRWIDIVTKTS